MTFTLRQLDQQKRLKLPSGFGSSFSHGEVFEQDRSKLTLIGIVVDNNQNWIKLKVKNQQGNEEDGNIHINDTELAKKIDLIAELLQQNIGSTIQKIEDGLKLEL